MAKVHVTLCALSFDDLRGARNMAAPGQLEGDRSRGGRTILGNVVAQLLLQQAVSFKQPATGVYRFEYEEYNGIQSISCPSLEWSGTQKVYR